MANGATTIVFDIHPDRLRRLLTAVPRAITGIADAETVRETVRNVDVLIGAVLMPGERTPNLVTRAMVESMPPGSVIVDVSIDQGGCVETSRPTSINDPVFVHAGVVHYAVPNMTAGHRPHRQYRALPGQPALHSRNRAGWRRAGPGSRLRSGPRRLHLRRPGGQ